MSIRHYIDEYGDFNVDVDCMCHGCLLRISSFKHGEEMPSEIYFSFWQHSGRNAKSIINRVKAAYKMLRTGHGYEEVVVCRKAALELSKVLADTFDKV